MRSTITLEPDVQRLVERTMNRNKKSFKETVNAAIRRGLSDPKRMASVVAEVPSFRLGLMPGIDPQRLNTALDDALSDDASEALRKQP
jgi:hypothetical protein